MKNYSRSKYRGSASSLSRRSLNLSASLMCPSRGEMLSSSNNLSSRPGVSSSILINSLFKCILETTSCAARSNSFCPDLGSVMICSMKATYLSITSNFLPISGDQFCSGLSINYYSDKSIERKGSELFMTKLILRTLETNKNGVWIR